MLTVITVEPPDTAGSPNRWTCYPSLHRPITWDIAWSFLWLYFDSPFVIHDDVPWGKSNYLYTLKTLLCRTIPTCCFHINTLCNVCSLIYIYPRSIFKARSDRTGPWHFHMYLSHSNANVSLQSTCCSSCVNLGQPGPVDQTIRWATVTINKVFFLYKKPFVQPASYWGVCN